MINNTLVYFKNKASFEEELEAGNISDQSIVFVEESGEIWTHGSYYTEYEKIKRVLFSTSPGSVADAIKNLRNSILGKVSEDYNTLEKIEAFLKNPTEFAQGPGIEIMNGEGNKKILSVRVDKESIDTTNDGKLKVKTVDGGLY